MKSRKLIQKFALVPLSVAISLLGACAAGKKDFVSCPQITAPIEGLSAFQRMDNSQEIVDIRFNGVRSVCDLRNDGSIKMALAIGLKLKRLGDGESNDVVGIKIAIAVVDSYDVVLRTETTKFVTGFAKGDLLKYPAAEHKIIVNSGERVVLSLLPAP